MRLGVIKMLVKGLIKIGIIGLSFFAGYSFYKYLNEDPKYYIKRVNERTYLVDKYSSQSLEIDQESFQLGSIRHRLLSLLKDEKFIPTLESLLDGNK